MVHPTPVYPGGHSEQDKLFNYKLYLIRYGKARDFLYLFHPSIPYPSIFPFLGRSI